jgi:hypothetical protein
MVTSFSMDEGAQVRAADSDRERVAEPATRRADRHPGWSPGGYGSPVLAWAAASAINLVIWAVVSIAALSLVYPWWIWVAGPWGVMLLVRGVSERRSVALGAS